jgi:putative MATE family efflux protein
VVLVYGLDLGIAGSAIGSVLAQVASAGWLVGVVVRAAREHDAPLSPDLPGIRAAAHAAVALVIRTLALRACLLVGTYAVTRVGSNATDVNVATHQIAITLWSFLAFALDAIAIAAQALTGRSLGRGDVDTTRQLTRRMVRWGWGSGIVAGAALAISSPFVGALFTTDQAVRDLLVPVLLVAAAGQPLAGVVFVLDGVLIGAGDGAYLAWAGLVVLAAYAPAALVAATLPHGLVWVWVAMTVVFMGARGVLLSWRARGDRWLVTGATPVR